MIASLHISHSPSPPQRAGGLGDVVRSLNHRSSPQVKLGPNDIDVAVDDSSLLNPVPVIVGRSDFDSVMRAERRRLFHIARSVLGDPAEAEDAVQETMVQAWRKWDTLRDPDARQAWLTRICLNYCFRRKPRLARIIPFGARKRDDDSSEEPEPSVDDPWTAQQPGEQPADIDLERAFDKLPPRQRAAVLLHYHHGYTVADCGDLMDCSAGTVRTHVQRALATLRKELADD